MSRSPGLRECPHRATADRQSEVFDMPKQKTHKGLAKRFKITARGKVKFRRPGNSHLSSHKSGARVRHLRKTAVLTGALAQKIIEKLTT